MKMDLSTFEELVAQTLDQLPAELAGLLENVVVQVLERPDHQLIEELGMTEDEAHELMGLYHGAELTGRGWDSLPGLPDVVLLFRENLLAACTSQAELVREVQLTLLHEIGHHFGFTEEEMDAWEEQFEVVHVPPVSSADP